MATAAEIRSPDQRRPKQIVFRPRRGKIWLMAILGFAYWPFALFLAWMPFGLAPEPQPWSFLAMSGALSAFVAGLGTWMLLLANRLRRAVMQVDDEGLFLFTNSYEWWLCRPWSIRGARLRWNEIHAVQYRVLPGVGEPLEQYILHTSQGRFLLSSFVWPDAAGMADLICERTGLPIATSLAELPPQVAERAKPGRSEQALAAAVRCFGWFCMIAGCLLALAFAAILATGRASLESFAAALLAVALLSSLGAALRKFRID